MSLPQPSTSPTTNTSTSTTATPLQPLATLPAPHGRGLASRAWQSSPHPSPSAPLLAVAAADKNAYIWSLRHFRLVSTISGGHKRSVRCVRWRDAQKKVTLATGSFDANVGVWEHGEGRRRRLWGGRGGEGEGDGIGDGIDGEDEGDGGDGDGDEDGEEWNFTTLLTGPDSEIKDIAFSPPTYGAQLLATSSRDKSVWVWEEVEDEEWETVAVLQEHSGDVKCVRWREGVRVKDGLTGETRVVGGREVLASGSYDDTVRLWRDVEEEGDWACVSVLEGHEGTVWDCAWEGWVSEAVKAEEGWEAEWEARLITCSDDLSVRVWRRELTEQEREKKRAARLENGVGGGSTAAVQQRMPSILKTTGYFETWVEQTRLPKVHVRSVYAIDWSRKTGLVVTCGGDGTVAVYREVQTTASEKQDQDVAMAEAGETLAGQQQTSDSGSTWEVVALIEAAHDEYEVNHVCWAPRRDDGKRFEDEEVIVSTGDDGDVKVWTLPDALGQVH